MFLNWRFLKPKARGIHLYNTKSKKKEMLKPLHSSHVSIYSCGPTVYAAAQIGNLRSYVFADTLHRALTNAEYKPKHIINITDVGHLTDDADQGEDKIEKAAKKEHRSAESITKEYTKAFLADLTTLNIVTGRYTFPKATDHIPEQIEIIEVLEEKGHTYKTKDGIYFDTKTFPKYGELGGINLVEQQGGARTDMRDKKNPKDFALWKFSGKEKRLQEWDSPWGVGFPGWHLECSAMAISHLGEQIDIHTGGEDHIYTHHNNEIAQSEAATGKVFASIWMHNAFLNLGGNKISKSEGNSIYLADLIKEGFSPLSLRYLFLEAHYRTPLSFTKESLKGAENALHRLYLFTDSLAKTKATFVHNFYLNRFKEAVYDDLNTAKALSLLWQLVRDGDVSNGSKKKTLERMDRMLGLELFGKRLKVDIPQEIKVLAEKREEYRKQKDFKKSDELRDRIQEKGYSVLDRDNGFIIEKL
ncbi:cysteine--tRNA ligase [Candidatus Wolfebacteria bacterium]|nr:cysteine--tRNA ligase [Candidatus Wolfebacteria bacterium]